MRLKFIMCVALLCAPILSYAQDRDSLIQRDIDEVVITSNIQKQEQRLNTLSFAIADWEDITKYFSGNVM